MNNNKTNFNQSNHGLNGLFVAAVLFAGYTAAANPLPVPLGTDSGFAVLAYSAISVNGLTTIAGNIGSYPNTTIIGLANVNFVSGGNQSANSGVMMNAENDLSTAFINAAGRAATTSYSAAIDFGGARLLSGVYSDPDAAMSITGTLTLNAEGDPNAVWIFQAASLTTAAGSVGNPMSMIDLINGAQASHVFWEVGSSATLGTYSDFVGTILASASITADTGATVEGRLLAENGAVTLDDNTITVPISSGAPSVPDASDTLPLLGSALVFLIGLRAKYPSRLL